MSYIKIICLEEPTPFKSIFQHISYYVPSTKKIKVNDIYFGIFQYHFYNQSICSIYKVYDLEYNYLGEYYVRGFKTLEEYRDLKIKQLLGV